MKLNDLISLVSDLLEVECEKNDGDWKKSDKVICVKTGWDCSLSITLNELEELFDRGVK